MRFRIHRGVEGRKLLDLLAPPLRRRLPSQLVDGGPYTVVVFALNQDPVRSGAAARAVARLGEDEGEPVLAFATGLTEDASAVLAERGIAAFTVSDFHWTDASFDRIRSAIGSPRKAPGIYAAEPPPPHE